MLYRVDIFNEVGSIRAVARIAAETDQDAIRLVEERSQDHRMELWQGTRLVNRFEAGPTEAGRSRRCEALDQPQP
jgi:hypothetical protein